MASLRDDTGMLVSSFQFIDFLFLGSPRSQAWITRAADLVEASIAETFGYYAFPEEHWRRIRTNKPLERILREIRRRTRVVGAFPDGQAALNLAAARLRHVAGTEWSTITRSYLVARWSLGAFERLDEGRGCSPTY